MPISTALQSLDKTLNGGLPDGKLTVIVGQHSDEKSQLAAHLAAATLRSEKDVVVVSTEHHPEDFPARVEAALLGTKQPAKKASVPAEKTRWRFHNQTLRQFTPDQPTVQSVERYLRETVTPDTGLVVLSRLEELTNGGEPLLLDDDLLTDWLARVKVLLAERNVPCVATTTEGAPGNTVEVIRQMADVVLSLVEQRDAIDANLRALRVLKGGLHDAVIPLGDVNLSLGLRPSGGSAHKR